MKVAVARDAEVAPGEVRCVSVRGVKVALIRTEEGDLHALRAVCPHQQAPLNTDYGNHCSSDGGPLHFKPTSVANGVSQPKTAPHIW